jgi:hypothetical protein
MFAPSREQARRFLFDLWRRYRAGQPIAGLEQTALAVILLHPEYHPILEAPERYLDRDYSPEAGEPNPFLHLSLHLAVAEQLSIDQPAGIRGEYQRIRQTLESEHDALHALLECLGETLWRAQRLGSAPDEQVYLDCLRRRG